MGTYVGSISCISHEVFHDAHVGNLEYRGESKTIKKNPTDFYVLAEETQTIKTCFQKRSALVRGEMFCQIKHQKNDKSDSTLNK